MRGSLAQRIVRILAVLGLTGALLLPAMAVPAKAADDKLVLRVGLTQDLDSLNPYTTILVAGYEVFQLSYNLLVDFGPNLEPVPGFADSWERSADGTYWTFHIREGMKWSDGTPATSQDACYSWRLDLAANKADDYVGEGYINPALADAGVTKLECPDDQTMIAYTNDASERVLQTYIPILPKHIWGDTDYEAMADAQFSTPLVGTGPYYAAEWQTSQFVRFERNPNYWGNKGAADEIVIQFFKNDDTMIQALKAGEIDYARGPNADQLKALATEPNIATVVGSSNGWTQLAFNTYGTGTGNTIQKGGPSTKALLDPAFRDALGYAIDKDLLVERILGGFGDPGSTVIAPVLGKWHVDPATPRTFDIELAKQKLDAAGYPLDGSGARLDKQGNPISLRLLFPSTDDLYAKAAQFVKDWYAQVGIKVSTQSLDSSTLADIVLPPEACPKKDPDCAEYRAKYDIELWGWSWGPDPNEMMAIFKCDAIGSSSDSQYCNPKLDDLFAAQLAAQTDEERASILAEMQNLIYDEAPYDILFYDSNLAAYRTDRFGGWQNQPISNGTPLFTYSTLQYTMLTDATVAPPTEAPSLEPGQTAAPATPAPSGDGGTGTGGGDNTALYAGLVGIAALAAIVAVVVYRRRSAGGPADEEE